MVLAGHQPNYWPYPGLLGKIMKFCDVEINNATN